MIQIINNIIGWERNLEIEEEKRSLLRSKTDANYLPPPQPCSEGRRGLYPEILNFIKQANHLPVVNQPGKTMRACEEK